MTISVLVLRPDEDLERMEIDDTPEGFQGQVGGMIQMLPSGLAVWPYLSGVVCWVNENGRAEGLSRNLKGVDGQWVHGPLLWVNTWGESCSVDRDGERAIRAWLEHRPRADYTVEAVGCPEWVPGGGH